MEKDKKKDAKKKQKDTEVVINPESEAVEEAVGYSERKRRSRTMRRFKRRLEIGRKRQDRRKADKKRLGKRSRRAAINLVRSKVGGKDYKNLSIGQKMTIDQRVSKRKKALSRIATRLMPNVRRKDNSKLFRKSVNEAFELAFESHVPLKRPHQMMEKDGKVKTDKRFKIFRKKVDEMTDYELADFAQYVVESENASLNENWEDAYYRSGKGSNKKPDPKNDIIKKALDALNKMVSSKGARQSIQGYAFDITRSFNLSIGPRELANLYTKTYGVPEGFETYRTESEVNDLFEENSCALVTREQMKRFESVVDQLFKKYGIDFEFTKHFGERLSHGRNDPCITLKELAEFIKRIYASQGRKLKGIVGAEAVLKDIQKNLNIPVAVEYDSRNDEIDVVMKTIMRKANFRTPNKIIKY
jgi:hypothetical protein